MTKRKERGRSAKPYPKIPDTYENIIKALVRPVKKDASQTISERDDYDRLERKVDQLEAKVGKLPTRDDYDRLEKRLGELIQGRHTANPGAYLVGLGVVRYQVSI